MIFTATELLKVAHEIVIALVAAVITAGVTWLLFKRSLEARRTYVGSSIFTFIQQQIETAIQEYGFWLMAVDSKFTGDKPERLLGYYALTNGRPGLLRLEGAKERISQSRRDIIAGSHAFKSGIGDLSSLLAELTKFEMLLNVVIRMQRYRTGLPYGALTNMPDLLSAWETVRKLRTQSVQTAGQFMHNLGAANLDLRKVIFKREKHVSAIDRFDKAIVEFNKHATQRSPTEFVADPIDFERLFFDLALKYYIHERSEIREKLLPIIAAIRAEAPTLPESSEDRLITGSMDIPEDAPST